MNQFLIAQLLQEKVNRYTAFFRLLENTTFQLFLKHIYRPYLNQQIKLYKITLFYTIRTIFSP